MRAFLNANLKTVIYLAEMESIPKQCILNIARRAGIKTISDDCYETIRNIMGIKLCELAKHVEIVNTQKGTKTISNDIIAESLKLQGKRVTNT